MSRRLSRLAGALALSCAALLAVPATAAADPGPDPLAQAIATLQSQGGTDLAAATAIADSRTPVAENATVDPFAALDAANKALTDFGITPFFYPTAAINCAATPGAPLGIVPGLAGGAAGPWPQLKAPSIPGLPTLGIPALNAVDSGETMFAFIPAGITDDSDDKSGMQVAWFNVNTLRGGFADFGGLTTTLADSILTNSGVPDIAKKILRPFVIRAIDSLPAAGARAVPVETGTGTVLAAVFGTVNHKGADGADKSCFFFPTVGLIDVA